MYRSSPGAWGKSLLPGTAGSREWGAGLHGLEQEAGLTSTVGAPAPSCSCPCHCAPCFRKAQSGWGQCKTGCDVKTGESAHGACFLGTLMFCLRDLKVSNLLMTDKGCVKTGGCRVLAPCVWRWLSVGIPLVMGVSVLASTLKNLSSPCLCCSGFWPGPGLWCPSEANDPQGGHPLVSPSWGWVYQYR